MFDHALFPKLHLREFDTPEGRFYQTPIGDLPSVTTVLGRYGDKSGLVAWKEYIDGRDGVGTADKITYQSSQRGDAVHKLTEDYLGNKEDWKKGAMPVNLGDFLKIKGILDANVKKVYGLEFPVYSLVLRAAGKLDAAVDWNSFNTIIDIKTVRKPVAHDGEKLRKWQYQVTAYAIMIEERFHKPFEQSIILAMIANEDPQVFIFSNLLYRVEVQRIFCNR